jgi:hypothetical protein
LKSKFVPTSKATSDLYVSLCLYAYSRVFMHILEFMWTDLYSAHSLFLIGFFHSAQLFWLIHVMTHINSLFNCSVVFRYMELPQLSVHLWLMEVWITSSFLAAVKIHVQVSMWAYALIFLGSSRVQYLYHMAGVYLTF